jgi:MYXO-CTERM domain-containing protein
LSVPGTATPHGGKHGLALGFGLLAVAFWLARRR